MKRTWRLSIILLLLVVCALALSLAIVSADFGTNWTGQFYNSTDFTGGVVETEVYATGLNFDWDGIPEDDDGAPLPTVTANDFSVRFTSTQTYLAGRFQFQITANDGIRLYIDGVLVLDDFSENDLTTYTIEQDLTEGDHTLSVEFFNADGDAILQVQWFLVASETSTPVPTSTPIVVNANVVRVGGLSLRTGPYLGASLIGVLRPGNVYNLALKNNSEGLFTWYYLTTDSGYSGWASGRYLELTNEDTILAEVNTAFDTASGEPNRGVVAVPRANMNVRVRPSTRTTRLTQMPWGAEGQVLARTVQGGKDFWYLVRYGDVVGWIYAPFVGIRGDINNIPVY
jgi:hypothetical protein